MAIELTNSGGGQADETAVTTGNSSAGGDPWNLVTIAVGAEVTYDVVNSSTWHRFSTGATSGQARVEWTSTSITAAMPRIYGGFWFRIPAAALGVNNTYLMRARAATVQTTRISVSTGLKLQIRNSANSAAQQSAASIAADTDYWVRYDIAVGAAANGTVEWYNASGTLIEALTAVAANFSTGNVDEVGYGIASNVSSQPPYFLRGFVSSSTAWPAPPGAPASATPSGLTIPLSLGAPSVAVNLSTAPSGIAVPLPLGAPAVALNRSAAPSGVALPLAVGTPAVAVNRAAAPAGLTLPVALGTPAASILGAAPAGIALTLAMGGPATAYAGAASPAGVAIPVAIGNPRAGAALSTVARPPSGTVARPPSGFVTR